MTTTITQNDILLAILSMDAYNRGYNQSMVVPGNQIGTATFDDDLGDAAAQAADFYAVSYDLGGGEKVISFRGTDNLNALDPQTDIWTGWTIGAGFAGGTQADLALNFYQTVTGQSAFSGAASGVTLTGHSLGGGLAGFLSALSGTSAVGFDHMPFYEAAIAAHAHRVDQGLSVSK